VKKPGPIRAIVPWQSSQNGTIRLAHDGEHRAGKPSEQSAASSPPQQIGVMASMSLSMAREQASAPAAAARTEATRRHVLRMSGCGVGAGRVPAKVPLPGFGRSDACGAKGRLKFTHFVEVLLREFFTTPFATRCSNLVVVRFVAPALPS